MHKDSPPWDINWKSDNPLDTKMAFKPALSIFDMLAPKDNAQPNIALEEQKTNHNHSHYNINKETSSTQLLAVNEDTKNINTQHSTLALKYRPKIFEELIGQDSISKTLCLALDTGKIANAYLLSGLRGSGKTSTARIFARCLQCSNGVSSTPCGECDNCIASLSNRHMDIIELDGASNRKIDDIRDLIEQTKYKPAMGRFKVFIIDEVHMLTKEAFNSLLKTLEEPPSFVKFILATTDPLKVPPTILSRTQHFRFKKIPLSILKNHIASILQKEKVIADSNSIEMIIRNGHGSVRDTLTLLDQASIFCQNELTIDKLATMFGSLDPKNFDLLFNALLKRDMQECRNFVKMIQDYESEMILDELAIYIREKIKNGEMPPIMGMRYANIIIESKNMLSLDCDNEFCLLLTVLKMLEAQKLKNIDSAIKELELKGVTLDSIHTESNAAQKQHDYDINNTDSKPNIEDRPTNLQENFKNQIPSPDNEQLNIQEIGIIHQAKEDSNTLLYQSFLQKLSNRDYEIGEIFKNKITFNGILENNLNLISYATNEENLKLRSGYNGILSLAKEIFGESVKIKVEKKEATNDTDSEKKMVDFVKSNKELLDSMKSNLGVREIKVMKI